jgi:hypothetical protein
MAYLLFHIGAAPFGWGLIFVLISFLYTRNPVNPWFWILPSLLYWVPSTIYLIRFGGNHIDIISVVFLGFFALLLGLGRKTAHPIKRDVVDFKFFQNLYHILIIILLVRMALSEFGFDALSKFIFLSFQPLLGALLLGVLMTYTTKGFYASITKYIPFVLAVLYFNYTATDVSRLSIIVTIVTISLILVASRIRPGEYMVINNKNYIVGVIIFIVLTVMFYESIILGGDVLILHNLRSIIEEVNRAGSHEPFMLFHNGLFILFPEQFWFSQKPTGFNSSSWYLSNILGVDPANYPWGVGTSMFGSAYIYGGYAVVFLSFIFVGLFFRKIASICSNQFWFGFALYFMIALPFALIRMDESFLFQSFLVSVTIVLMFISRYKSIIDSKFR